MGIDLLYLAREHDLPPKWDGHAVEWEGWRGRRMFICGRQARDVCPQCGSVSEPVVNQGRYWMTKRKGTVLHPALLAIRCPDCKRDVIAEGFDLWDLGPEDYGDEGSVNPNANVTRMR